MRNALNKTTTKIKLKNRRTFETLVGLLEEKVEIEDIAEWTEIDLYSKKLDLLSHLEMMVWSSIKDCEKLRELSDALKGVDAKKDGLVQISSSQLSKVNKTRDYRISVLTFYELIYSMRKYHILWKFKRELKILGIDSSFVKINRYFARKGYCSSTKSVEKGIKIHVGALLGKLTLPLTAMITPGDVSEQKEFDYVLNDCSIMIDLSKVILVFDKGYWNFDRFADLTEKEIRFITPMKKGTVYEVLSERNWKNISDKRIKLSNGLELRLIQVETEEEIGEYLTNIFDLSAMDIVHAYEIRWSIEIFFREIKSYLKIDHFMSKSLNGMLIQIFCTLIAYALMVLFKIIYGLHWVSIIEIKRWVKYNIIEEKSCLWEGIDNSII
jgi:hypothetical protein